FGRDSLMDGRVPAALQLAQQELGVVFGVFDQQEADGYAHEILGDQVKHASNPCECGQCQSCPTPPEDVREVTQLMEFPPIVESYGDGGRRGWTRKRRGRTAPLRLATAGAVFSCSPRCP